MEINKDDHRMINGERVIIMVTWFKASLLCCVEFGSLTQVQLMEKVRALQNMAYQLGVEEGGYTYINNHYG